MGPARGGDIKIVDLHKTFVHEGKPLHVLKGIDLELPAGAMASIKGKSGAGKSTFLHILGTLDHPSRGTMHFGDQNVFELSTAKLARFRNENVGFVFQFHHLLPEFTAIENVMMPALINRQTRAEARQSANALLTTVGLAERLTHKPGELSGGEQQRVALARALMMEPTLLLADEPTGNLDPKTGEAIHQLFEKLNRERNLTIVVVTHDPTLAERMPRQFEMDDGQLEEITPGQEEASPMQETGEAQAAQDG